MKSEELTFRNILRGIWQFCSYVFVPQRMPKDNSDRRMDKELLIQTTSSFAYKQGGNYSEEARQAYASYKPSFMEIKVPFDFQGDIDVLSDQDLGVLFHEYVHYLQNLSTPWGLYTSMAEYGEMVNTYRAIQESGDEIVIPVKPFSTKQFEKQKRLIDKGNGYSPFGMDRSFRVDRSKKVTLSRTVETIDGRRISSILCKLSLDDGVEMEFPLGASIIKESMAGMMQGLIDPTAKHENDDIPYNLVRILCEDKFEEVAKDPVKMITVCYMSLFSMSPGEVLINELDNANRNPQLTAKELLDGFMDSATVTMGGNKYPVYVFYRMLKDKFLDILGKTLMMEPAYIKEALERADVSKGYIPVLSILYDKGITRDKIKTLMEGVGFPWVWTGNGYVTAKLDNEGEKESVDVSALMAHYMMYSYLRYPNYWRCCPMRHICLKGNIEPEDCLDNKPWEGKTCVMSIMADWLELGEKRIKFA